MRPWKEKPFPEIECVVIRKFSDLATPLSAISAAVELLFTFNKAILKHCVWSYL